MKHGAAGGERERAPSSGADAAPEGPPAQTEVQTEGVLGAVECPVASAAVSMVSGRRYAIASEHDRDRLEIRGRNGDVVLRVEVTDAGPVLSFSGAVLELSASRRLHLSAEEISVEARGDASLEVGGSLRERVLGDHHVHVEGDERVEAAKLELQASREGAAVRAMRKIALDGERIGLNDDPAPAPFPWSAIARGPEET
ncbi:hypothetical protein [Sorangium sp. So ce388]|uniref:hypothetical protein n=1 Tax=Sorangium sp. So ce388 TaxID=3133309 RepID=UPI003F5C2197